MSFSFSKKFPKEQLKALHGELTNLEVYIQVSAIGRKFPKDEVEMIYSVQELIEDIINNNKKNGEKVKKG